jgi:CBS domain-containing protein/mannitol/fructose-specific phosphotransferase system IIA component (Ntr-type)
MNAFPLLRREHVAVPLSATTLGQAMSELAGRLGTRLRDPGLIEQAFAEQKGGTAVRIGPDIALPHYRTEAVDDVIVAFGVSTQPLDTGDPEWQPGPLIVALVLAPTDATSLYLQAVSTLARALRQRDTVSRITEARSADQLFDIPAIAGLELKPRLAVRDAMTSGEFATRPDATVRIAVEQMLRTRTRALAVVGDKDEILGIVSEADVMRGLARGRTRSEGEQTLVPPLRVRDVMTRSVLCVSDGADLDEVANLMVKKDMGEIPVAVEGKLAGLVRREDILRTLYGR